MPSVSEVYQLLQKEAQRPLAQGKEQIHYPEFGLLIDWLNILDVNSSFVTNSDNWQQIVSVGERIKPEVVTRTLSLIKKSHPTLTKLCAEISQYLGEEDQPQPSDLIFVYGSKNLSRIEKAVELWKQKLASRILITGRSPLYQESEPEAVIFKNHAIQLGVPEDKIILEPEAISYADNVRRSLNLMDKLGVNYQQGIIQITAWFGQRRAWSHMMKYLPEPIPLYRVNAPIQSPELRQESWYQNESGIKLIFNEFVKMRMGVELNTN